MLSMMFLSTILVPILNENGATFKILGLLILRRNINLFISVIMAGTITAAPTVQGAVVEPAAEAAQVNVAEATSQEQTNTTFDFGLDDVVVAKGSSFNERVKDMIAVDGYRRFNNLEIGLVYLNFYGSREEHSKLTPKFRNCSNLPYIDKDGNLQRGDFIGFAKGHIVAAMAEFGYGIYTSKVKDIYKSDLTSEDIEANHNASILLSNMLDRAKIDVIAKGVIAGETYTSPYSNKEEVAKRTTIVYHIVNMVLDEDRIVKALSL